MLWAEVLSRHEQLQLYIEDSTALRTAELLAREAAGRRATEAQWLQSWSALARIQNLQGDLWAVELQEQFARWQANVEVWFGF